MLHSAFSQSTPNKDAHDLVDTLTASSLPSLFLLLLSLIVFLIFKDVTPTEMTVVFTESSRVALQ